MSDEINWDIDSLRSMVVELNRKGIEVKNKVANIFWQFRYQVTPYWEGENYNKVMEFVNEFVDSDGSGGFGTGFKAKTDMVAYEIPKKIEDFVNIQAQAGGGQAYNQNLISAYDSGNSDVWKVPLSVISKDGARRISVEKVQQFFIGTTDPSVRGEVELAKTKLNEYLAIFDAYEPYTKGNAAAVTARADVEEFINMFKERTDYMLGVVIDVATQEINGIQEVDIESVKIAHQGVDNQGQDPNPSQDPSQDPNPGQNPGGNNGSSSGSGYDWSTDPCHKIPSGVNAPDGYNWDADPCHFIKTGSGYSPVNNGGKNTTSTWNDPCHFYGPGGSTTDPCHFYASASSMRNAAGYDNINPTSARSKGYTYDPNQDWSKMSDKDKLARGYLEYRASKMTSTGDDYLENNTNLTDDQKEQIRELSNKQTVDYDHSGYDKPEYDRTADWSSLSSDERVAKAYDDPDFVSKLSDSEQNKLSEAQYQAGKHVDYDVPSGGLYAVDKNKLNDRQRVQWAIDMREEIIRDNYEAKKNDAYGPSPEGYWRRTGDGLTAEQLAEVDAEVNQHMGEQDIGATYANPYGNEE